MASASVSGVLKGTAVDAAIRPLQADGAALPSMAPVTTDPTLPLRDRIAELEGKLAQLTAAMPARLDEAREDGRQIGLKERDQSAAERLQLLESALSAGLGIWSDKLTGSHDLALEVARSVLAQMIGNPDWQRELVQDAIAYRLAEIGAKSMLSVRVSEADFAEGDLGSIASEPHVRVTIDPELKSGDCVIDLSMGQVEIGPGAQWRRVAGLLDELAGGPC